MPSYYIVADQYYLKKEATAASNLIEETLTKRAINYQMFPIKYEEQFQTHLKKITKQVPTDAVIIVIGNNNSLDLIIGEILQQADKMIPVGFIPVGEKNHFAAELQISSSPITALNQILMAKQAVDVNLGVYHDYEYKDQGCFVDEFSVGLDAYILSLKTAPEKKQKRRKKRNIFSFFWQTFFGYLNQEPFSVTVRVGNKYEFFKHAFVVNVANHHAGISTSLPLKSNLAVKQPKLELFIVENINFLKYLFLSMIIYFRKETNLPSIHHYQSSELHLIINSLEFYQVDRFEKGNKYFDVHFTTKEYPFWMKLANYEVS